MRKDIPLEKIINQGFHVLYDKEIKKMLEEEAKKLGEIILKYQQQYEDSYKPSPYARKKYARTGKTRKGIRQAISGVKVAKTITGEYVATLDFMSELMYHDSYVEGSNKKGHAFMLISDGWNHGQRETKHSRMLGHQVYRFTYYEGYDTLGKAIREYNKTKPSGVEIVINRYGEYYK